MSPEELEYLSRLNYNIHNNHRNPRHEISWDSLKEPTKNCFRRMTRCVVDRFLFLKSIEGNASISSLGEPGLVFGERDLRWSGVRDDFIKDNPRCAVCSQMEGNHIHHIVPVHVCRSQGRPELELEVDNLITLCPPHHFTFGHFCNWSSWNPNVLSDCEDWRDKMKYRPKLKDNRVVVECSPEGG